MSGQLWSAATVIGPIVLIVVIGYALITRRSLNSTEKQDQKNAVEDLYRGGEGGPAAPATTPTRNAEKDG